MMPTNEERQVVQKALVELRDGALPRVGSTDLVDDGVWETLTGYWKFAVSHGLKPGLAVGADPAKEKTHSWRFVYHCAVAALMSLNYVE